MYGKSLVMAFTALALEATVAGAQECDPEASATRPKEEQDALRNWFAAEPKIEELRIVFRAPRALVRQRLTNAMLACSIPIARSRDDVIEADYVRRRRQLVMDVVDQIVAALPEKTLILFEDLQWTDDLSLEIVAAQIQVQSVLVSLRLRNSHEQIKVPLTQRRFHQSARTRDRSTSTVT